MVKLKKRTEHEQRCELIDYHISGIAQGHSDLVALFADYVGSPCVDTAQALLDQFHVIGKSVTNAIFLMTSMDEPDEDE